MWWSYREALEVYQVAAWPRTAANNNKKDNGLLNILHKPIEFLADANHRVKTYAGPIFALGRLPKGLSEDTSTDGERMKRNMGYAIHQNKTGDLDQMRKAMTAVLEHHFNDHMYCGAWCPALFWKDDEKVRKALKYRCKTKHSKLYEQSKTHHDKFVTGIWMKDLMHKYDSNKPKSFNGFLTKFLPKHKFFAMTIINQGRTYLAITINSVEYVTAYKTMFTLLGIEESETTREHHRRLDRRRMLGKKRKTTTRYKQKRNELKNKKISEGKKIGKGPSKGT
jgi:hypothetical protein